MLTVIVRLHLSHFHTFWITMFEYIKGEIAALSPVHVIVEAGGVGYFLHISLATHAALNGQKEAKVLVHHICREDLDALYGFAENTERAIFRLLIGVSGVGANTARTVLSSVATQELYQAILSGDASIFEQVKGIGGKTAQKIVIELKDKMGKVELGTASPAATVLDTQTMAEAISAMEMLGYNRATAMKTVKKVLTRFPTATVEEIVKYSLKEI